MRRVFRDPLTQPRPDYPVVVDWEHPLAAGLIGCYVSSYTSRINVASVAPNIRDFTGIGTELYCQDGSSTMGLSPLGFAANSNGLGANSGWQTTLSAGQRPSFGVSLFVRCYKAGNGTSISSYPMIFGCQWTNTNTAPYDTWDITNGPTDAQVNFSFNVGGTATGPSVTSAIATGSTYNFGVAAQADGIAGHIRPFINGVLQTTGTPGSGSIGYGATPTLVLGGKVGASCFSNMQIACGYIWNYMLPDTYMEWLNAEPYVMLRPVVRRRFVLPAAGVGGATQSRVMVQA